MSTEVYLCQRSVFATPDSLPSSSGGTSTKRSWAFPATNQYFHFPLHHHQSEPEPFTRRFLMSGPVNSLLAPILPSPSLLLRLLALREEARLNSAWSELAPTPTISHASCKHISSILATLLAGRIASSQYHHQYFSYYNPEFLSST